jgi:hypothetical protein
LPINGAIKLTFFCDFCGEANSKIKEEKRVVALTSLARGEGNHNEKVFSDLCCDLGLPGSSFFANRPAARKKNASGR